MDSSDYKFSFVASCLVYCISGEALVWRKHHFWALLVLRNSGLSSLFSVEATNIEIKERRIPFVTERNHDSRVGRGRFISDEFFNMDFGTMALPWFLLSVFPDLRPMPSETVSSKHSANVTVLVT